MGKVIKICRVFGVRSKEAAFITHATEEDGEPQLRVTKGKTYNTRGRIKEETDPRWLEAVAVDTMREVNAGHSEPAVVAALKPQLIQRSRIV